MGLFLPNTHKMLESNVKKHAELMQGDTESWLRRYHPIALTEAEATASDLDNFRNSLIASNSRQGRLDGINSLDLSSGKVRRGERESRTRPG
jgi:hypothetical protein